MPKKYVLKNKMWDEDKINRLAKDIKSNANSDRAIAEELLNTCKAEVEEALANDDRDAFTKLIAACTQALGQMGSANEKLLKLISILQKHQFKEQDMDMKDPSKGLGNGSLFSKLDGLLKDED
tara:strand:+ start:2149 stop:2517 length:369 start_codon:yes stop_codon:yes gene_type:complete